MSDLISEDTTISADGAVTGTLKYIDKMDSFGEGENSGHYFPVTLDSKYAGKDITVKGKKTTTAQDLEWLLYVASNDSKFTFSTEEDGDFLTLTFAGAELAQKQVAIFADLSTPVASVATATTAKKRGRPAKTNTTIAAT